MKHAFKMKSLVLSMAIAGSSVAALAPATTQAGVSGNIGMVSQYIFRGIAQSGGAAAAQAGVDYEHDSGVYAGLWTSEVGPGMGLEYDVYAGYGTELSGVTLGAGFTIYNYTKDLSKDSSAFDTGYQEVNLSVGYGPFTLGYDIGTHAKSDLAGKDEDYTVLTLTAEYGGAYATYGSADGFAAEQVAGKSVGHSWFELGYATEISEGFELSASLINASKEVSGYNNAGTGKDEDNFFMVFGITKSFDLM